jgi:hypothetical protein
VELAAIVERGPKLVTEPRVLGAGTDRLGEDERLRT